MRPIIAVTALLTIIDGSCSVSAANKIARYNRVRATTIRVRLMHRYTSIILIARDIHLNSDQGQSRHGLARLERLIGQFIVHDRTTCRGRRAWTMETRAVESLFYNI